MSLRLPTFVIGPESQGRGYRLLAPKDSPLPRPSDLAMVLMEWARTGEAEVVGRYPLPDGGAAMFRARYLRSAMLGEEAFLHGVVLDEAALSALDNRPELILDQIPGPDGSLGFGEQPLDVRPPAPPPARGPWPHQGLAWRDLHIEPDDRGRETVLLGALASIDPPEQRSRITGWVTSSRLVSRGALNLVHDSQLVIGGQPADAPLRQLPVKVETTGAVIPPHSWRAWLRLEALAREKPQYEPFEKALVWRAGYAHLSTQKLTETALRLASGVLPHTRMVDLLIDVQGMGEPMRLAVAEVAPRYLEALRRQGVRGALVLHVLASLSSDRSLVGRLLELIAPADIRAADETVLRWLLPIARDEIRTAAGKADTDLRAVALALIEAATPTLAEGEAELDLIGDIVLDWPEAYRRELLPLALPDALRSIYSRSHDLGLIVTRELVQLRHLKSLEGDLGKMDLLLSALGAERRLAEP